MGVGVLDRSLCINFLGRFGYGFCLGFGCLELRVFLSLRCLLGLRGLVLGCSRLFRTLGGFGFPSMAGCLFLCLGRLELCLLVFDRLALGRFLCRCCLLCSGCKIPLPALGRFGCCCLLSFLGLAPVRGGRLLLPLGGFSLPGMAGCFLLGLGRLGPRLLILGRLALGRCCLIWFGRRTPLAALGGVGCCRPPSLFF